jgi:hypothetical protein
MNRRLPPALFLAACGFAAMLPTPAAADHTTVGAGQTLALTEDLVLTGDDVLDVKGTADRCSTLFGNGHRIRLACVPGRLTGMPGRSVAGWKRMGAVGFRFVVDDDRRPD